MAVQSQTLVISDSDHASFRIGFLENAASMANYFSEKLGRLIKLLQMSDMMQMDDLKGEVEELAVKNLEDTWTCSSEPIWSTDTGALVTIHKVKSLVGPAEKYNCEKLLFACARNSCRCLATVKKSLDTSTTTELIKGTPKFAAALLVAFSEFAAR